MSSLRRGAGPKSPCTEIPLSPRLVLAADMNGCPNRCRHCYLGAASMDRLSPDDVRYAACQLREFLASDDALSGKVGLTVSTWMREPDNTPHYRDLYALEQELSDGPPSRFELLSISRLARDAAYARWAAEIGTTACQISFFGVRETQDWFVGRAGAWEDCLAATRWLVEAGIRPRWQLFITRALLPELDELLALAERTGVWRPGSGEDGGLFAHLPTPDGAAARLEPLRPAVEELKGLPPALLQASCTYLKRDRLWTSEAELYEVLLAATPEAVPGYPVPEQLALYLLPNWDVYSNMGTLEPWWRLGNLKTDGVGRVLSRYRRAAPMGMRVALTGSRRRLTEIHGDPRGVRAYGSADDLLTRYLAQECSRLYDPEDPFGEVCGALD